jgi:bacteriocin biosynthesis cyclodehydratase domain-containing protein
MTDTITGTITGTSTATPMRSGLDGVRPRLRHDVVFADTGEGVFLHHADGGFVLRGRSAYRWVSSLFPYMTGEHTVGELCDGLSDERRVMVEDIIRTLLDRGLVRDRLPAGTGEDLADAVRERFAPQLNFIEHYADDAAARYRRFRDARILVVGTGPTAVAASTSLLRNGLARLDLRLPTPAAVPDALVSEVATLNAAGCQATVQPVPTLGAGYDLVLAVEESLGLAGIRQLMRAGGPAVLPAMVVGHLAVLGPIVHPGQSPCWTCALLRLGVNLEPSDAAGMWRRLSLPDRGAVRRWPAGPVAQMIGNALAFDVFRTRTGCMPAETADALVVQDLDTLESARQRLLPHPECPDCGRPPEGLLAPPPTLFDVPAEIPAEMPTEMRTDGTESLEDTQTLDEEAMLERQAVLLSWYAGVFAEYADSSIQHSPLKVGRVRLGSGDDARLITAFDLHTVFGARIRAGRAAMLAYVDSLALPDVPAPTGYPVVPLDALSSATGLPPGPTSDGLVAARSLVTGQSRAVPVSAVFPYAAAGRAGEPTTAGAGCGADRREAIAAGLHSALAYEGLRAALRGDQPAVRLSTAQLGDDAELTFLLRSAERLDLTPRLLRLPGAEPGHAVLAVGSGPGRPQWTVGCATSEREAAAIALRDLLGLRQLSLAHIDPVDRGGELVVDLDPRAVPVALDRPVPLGTDETTGAEMLGRLAASGRDAVAVDTTPRDLQGAGFTTVRILLTRSGTP